MKAIRSALRKFAARLAACESMRSGAAVSFLLFLGGVPVPGCGEYINLGGGAEQWFDGDAVDGGGKGEPGVMYEGTKRPVTYAVDDATLYTAFQMGDPGPRVATLKSCALSACASTVRVLYQSPASGLPSAEPVQQLALSGSEIFFNSFDGLNVNTILACPRTGCDGAPRQLAQVGSTFLHFTANEDAVYWTTLSSIQRCSKDANAPPTERALNQLITSTPGLDRLGPFVIAGEYIYIAGFFALGRIKRDLSEDPDWIYVSDVPIRNVAVDDKWVYFGIATLTGEVHRCPLTGCVGDPEVVVTGQRYPTSLSLYGRTLYWFDLGSDRISGAVVDGSLLAADADDPSTPRKLATNLVTSDERVLANAHHIYWRNVAGNGTYQIRTVAR